MATQDKILLVIKGILLYTTIIMCIVSTASIDSLYDKGYLIVALATCATLIYTCYKVINKEEFNILSLNKWLN